MKRQEIVKKVGLFGVIGNIFLLIIKALIGFTSKSQAMIADAVNSAGDIFSSLMTFIGGKIASAPQDDDHNFGHGKAEYIFSLLISIFMLLIAGKIFMDSINSIINKEKFTFSIYLIIVCLLTILVKLCLFLYCHKLYKKQNNILIKANRNDHRNDVLLTLGTLASIILGKYGFYFFDGIFGALTSIYIFASGINIFRESYKVLMDESLTGKEKEEIICFIMQKEDVKNVSDFKTVATGYKYIAILTIDVDGNLNTFTSHNIADTLELEIPKVFKKIYKVTVHVNPV